MRSRFVKGSLGKKRIEPGGILSRFFPVLLARSVPDSVPDSRSLAARFDDKIVRRELRSEVASVEVGRKEEDRREEDEDEVGSKGSSKEGSKGLGDSSEGIRETRREE